MADKKEVKSSSGGEEVLWIILGLIVLAVAVFGLTGSFDPTYLNIYALFAKILPAVQKITHTISDPAFWSNIGYISMSLSLISITVIVFSFVRMFEIQSDEEKRIDYEIRQALARQAEKDRNENPRWKYIQTLVGSPNESDWRIAIIEADTMLDELLADRGYSGATLAEKLKEVDAGTFYSLQNAWDAHNMRNKIAHEGSDFYLSEVEAVRTIKMFQNVFEELRAI
jgi:hypothetical protein